MIFDNIVLLCKERNTNIMNVEKACGLGNGTISGWKDSNPRVDRLKLVADFFGVSIDDLMSDEHDV